jgi:hypothetical protein
VRVKGSQRAEKDPRLVLLTHGSEFLGLLAYHTFLLRLLEGG